MTSIMDDSTRELIAKSLIKDFSFKEYQKKAAVTDLKTGNTINENIMYYALGLNGEAGEVAEKVKKAIRDKHPSMALKEELIKELGDVLWYMSNLAKYFNIPLEDIAQGNIDKIMQRKQNDKIHGSGDNR